IVRLMLQKRGKVVLPLCAPCFSRWGWSETSLVLFAVLGLFALCGGLAWIGEQIKRGGFGPGLIVGLVLWIAGLIVGKLVCWRKYQVRCTLIENEEVTLVFPDESLARGVVDLKMR